MPRRTAPVDPRFAARLRDLRQQRGLSLRELARAAYSSKSHLQEFETGAATPSMETAQRLDAALGADGELARLAAPATAEPPVLPRREFVTGTAGLAFGVPAVTYLSHGRQIGADAVTTLRHRTARLRRLDDYLGGADTYEPYDALLRDTMTLVQDGSYGESTGRALLAVVAEQAQLAGWAAFDAGWHADADRLFRMSLSAAEEAPDRGLAGNAWAFLAYLSTSRRKSGLDAAIASCEVAGSAATPRVRALLYERRAWTHAVAGQTDQVESALDQAEAALGAADGRSEPDWVFWVDRDEIQIMRGRCWTVLHRPVRAIPVLEQVLARYADTHARDKALYLTWLADAHLDANEVERACAVLGQAVDLAVGVGSVRPHQRVREVVRRLTGHRDLACVDEIRVRSADAVRLARPSTAAASPGMSGSPRPPQPR